MEILEFIIGLIVFTIGGVICVVGSIAAAEESAIRKKNMRAGTHDYYGNKLGDD